MRIAVFGTIALVAALLLALRADRSPGTSALFHGQTPEGLLVALAAEDGKVHSAYLRWRMKCDHARAPYVSTIKFGPTWGDRFEHDGREFRFSGRDEQRASDGGTIRYDVALSGRLSEDQRLATGHGRTTETRIEGGRPVGVCRSNLVPWTVYRGAPRP